MAAEISSIERFIQNRASQLLIGSYSRTGFAWQIGIGAICLAVGGGLLVAGLITRGQDMIVGSLGPLIAGAVNVPIGFFMKKRFQQAPNEPQLSIEARHFLLGLIKQTSSGLHQNRGTWGSVQIRTQTNPLVGESFLHQLGKHWGFIPKTPKDVLARPVYELLETACHHYNRVQGLLEGRQGSSIAKMGQLVRSGADEAIFQILHSAATMHKFPETVGSTSRDCEDRIRALRELADRLEKLHSQPHLVADVPVQTTAIDSALEELRLEGLARTELSQEPNEGQHLREGH